MRAPKDGGSVVSDIDAGSYGAPDHGDQKIVRTLAPTNEWYIQAVKDILASGEFATINALKSNVEQFREQVRDKVWQRNLMEQNQALMEQNRELSERVAGLEKEIKKEPAARDSSLKRKKNRSSTRELRIRENDDLQNSGNS